MNKIGPIAIFCLSALLSGCDDHYYCPTPDKPSFTGYTCWWEIKVTKIDGGRDEVTGSLATKGPQQFTFRVRNAAKLKETKQLVEGNTYLFNNGKSSPYLEPFPEGSRARSSESHRDEVREVK